MEADSSPLVGFLFGNLDERGGVEADYLEPDAKEHLGALARVQGGRLNLQEELQADEQPAADSAAVQPAADARDFADEAELIEDAEQQAAAAEAVAAQKYQLGLVSAALQAGAAAEEEDYDAHEGVQAEAEQPQPAVVSSAAAAALPSTAMAPVRVAAVTAAVTAGARLPGLDAYRHLVRLPVLGQSVDGETVLRFSELYGYQGVMAGHVSTADDLRPPPLLPRRQRQQETGCRGQQQAEESGDEELLLLATDLEVPAEEVEDDMEMAKPLAPEPVSAAAAAPGHSLQGGSQEQPGKQQRARSMHPAMDHAQLQQQSDHAAGGVTRTAPAADCSANHADAGLPDSAFLPVNTLAWENRICWQGLGAGLSTGARPFRAHEQEADEAAAAMATAAAVRENGLAGHQEEQAAEQRQEAAAALIAQQQQAGSHQQGEDQQLYYAAAQADIAAMFQQQQQRPAVQFGNVLPVVCMPPASGGPEQQRQPHAPQPHWEQQQPSLAAWHEQQLGKPGAEVGFGGAAELPGLSSMGAAEGEARAAAESDEEESWALPMGPLLRLEQLRALAAGSDGGGQDEEQQHGRLFSAPDMLPVHRDRWEDRIAWEGGTDAHKLSLPGPALDLNDRNQAFELTRPLLLEAAAAVPAGRQQGAAADMAELMDRAAALVVEPQALVLPLPPRGSGFDAVQPEEVELWHLQQGLAREREYYHQARRKAGIVGTVRVLHAKLAIDLATLPILTPAPQAQEEVLALALWHTPRGKWWPIEASMFVVQCTAHSFMVSPMSWNVGGSKKKGSAGPAAVPLTITSLPGVSKTFQSVGLDSRLQDLWKHLVDNLALFKPAASMQPLILLPGKPPVPLPFEQSLLATGAVKEGQKQVKLAIAFQEIELLSTASADMVPANDNPALLRPPNAFSRKRDFSAAEPGHVVLLEYMEQQPPLLNRPGMGAKLVTYYRKREATDAEHQKLKHETPRWRVGAVQPLGDEDDSPFLGQLARGASSLTVESGLFRSLAFPYTPPHTDFLLLRTPAGMMQMRELSGTVVVGQELPMLRVPAPTAREVKDLEERRIYVHVFKHLRRQQAKLDANPAKQGQRASITLKALAEAFPARPPAMIRAYIKDACDLVVRPVGDTETFSLKDEARPPSEAELRKKLTPEEACALEACYVAAFRMKQRGLVMHEKLDKAAIEKLRLAAEMLPPDDSYQKAARLVEQAMQSAPWTLTDAFVTHFREGKAQLQLAGAADPTGRGFGYSFVRDVRHKHANADDVTKQMAKRQAGKVQGTDADLRRMTTAQAKERLRGYGLIEEEIQGLGRWTMIDMVRQLASAAAQDGTVDAAAVKFVRHQKTTMIELQRRAAERAQQILEKQIAVLNNSAAEDLGDQDALEAELERELAAAEEEAEGTGGPVPQTKKKGKREGTPTPDDEQRMMQQMRAEGLMATPAGGGSAAGTEAAGMPAGAGAGGPAPKEGPGTRRIRREIFLKAADGSWQKSHVIIYTGRDRPGQLHSLYQKEGTAGYPYGFGTRTIAGRPKELRLSYAAARGRGMGRSGSRPGTAGRGRGGGRGRGIKSAALDVASPAVARSRHSSRQRKHRQLGEEMLEADEMISDEGEYEYNEDVEAPYFAATMATAEEHHQQQPKRARSKKKQATAPAGWEQQQQQPKEPMPALPDDFAAALAAATMVRPPSTGVSLEGQQPAPSGGAFLPQVSAGTDMVLAVQQSLPKVQQQEPVMPKLKIKMSGIATIKQPPREPSPDYMYDYTVGEEEDEEKGEQQHRRSGKAADADYEVQLEQDDGSDEFVPDDEEEFSEDDGEERRFLKKRNRSRNFDAAPLARAGSRRSAGSTVGGRRGSGSSAHRTSGAGARSKGGSAARGMSGGGGGRQGKRSRSDFEEEFEEEEDEDVELSDEDAEMFEEIEDDAATSDEGAMPPPSRRRHATAAGGAGFGGAGQLGTVGHQLGAILGAIVQQLRNMKMMSTIMGLPPKMVRVYEMVFGKVPSAKHAPDYHNFVPKSSVIILPEVQKKAKAGRYLSLEQFRADLQHLYNNAVAYNSPGAGGAYGDPYFIDLAGKLLEDAEGLIARHLVEIQAAEAPTRGW